ncbi:MAG: alpha/beta hydrolase [Deltaproteobacteria bacterium]|nr:alpha/beta hydrolase [Deltaproteobacteria bacterium]
MSDTALENKRMHVIRARDGVNIFYESIGSGDKVLLLANGLGGRLYAWQPLIDEFWKEYRIVTWDYRGLFESSGPECVSRLSVRDQAEDGLEVLAAEKADRAVWVGWSMGVQVSLEAAAVRPAAVGGLVLLNGTWGHVFSSAFQPGLRLPFLPRYMHEVVEWFQGHPEWAALLARASKATTVATIGLFWLLLGRRALELRPVLEQYTSDVYRPDNFPNYLRLFQELDAHSAYHHLRSIDAPALVVSGRWDVVTPAYQSREIARRLRNATHLHITNGSHFVLVERPKPVLAAIRKFLETRAQM